MMCGTQGLAKEGGISNWLEILTIELVLIEDLLFLLRDIRVTPEEDSMLWKGGDSASFRIRVAYNLLVAPNPLVFQGKNI